MKLKLTKRTIAIAAALIFVVATGSAVAFWQLQKDDAEVAVDTNEGINYGPPTEVEKNEADAHKDELVEQQKNEEDNPSSTIKPLIITASYSNERQLVTVGGAVPGVLEDDGTCTIKLTKGSLTVTKTTQSVANVSRTECPPITINRNEFTENGTWDVSLSYASSTASGQADKGTVTIP